MQRALAAVVLLAVAACGGGNANDPLDPAYQPQITNDSVNSKFEFQLTGVQDGSASLVYTWQNPSTTASVDRSSSISAGAVNLLIRDAAQPPLLVYSGPLDGVTGSVFTAAGTPGAWTIEVAFGHATGTINFRVQKGP